MQVLAHWACAKISASMQQPDHELKDVLVSKLQTYRGIRYSMIAGHAESVGRKGLATLLLEYETCAADQVERSALTTLFCIIGHVHAETKSHCPLQDKICYLIPVQLCSIVLPFSPCAQHWGQWGLWFMLPTRLQHK